MQTTLFFQAVQAGDDARVRDLVAHDPSLAAARDEEGVSALLRARYLGRTDLVEALLAAAPELDVFDAAALGRTERLRALLDEDPSRAHAWSGDGFQPLHLAAFFGHEAGARLLVERGADVSAVARTPMLVQPLPSAAAAGETAIAELLLEAGADPNAEQEGGFRPLDAAVQNEDEALRRLLEERGATASR